MGASNANKTKDYPLQYFSASAVAAVINYPLWKASAIGQSGFKVSAMEVFGGAATTTTAATATAYARAVPSFLVPYVHAFLPPYKGLPATVLGMTWARAAIFWGSDYGRFVLQRWKPDWPISVHMALPPLVVSTAVQIVNQPIVRATIMLQNPQEKTLHTVWQALRNIVQNHGGLPGLWHGTSAGILKTVPKYCTAIIVKNVLEDYLLPPIPSSLENDKNVVLQRSAMKSIAAGVAGAVLTNPLDVLRNEMFKTNLGLIQTTQKLRREIGLWNFFTRGMSKNVVAVAIPVATTIFLTDLFIQLSNTSKNTPKHNTTHESANDAIIVAKK